MARLFLLLLVALLSACAPSSGAQTRLLAALEQFAAADRLLPPEAGGVLFVGSSSVRRWPLSESFPEQAILNRGVDGAELSEVSRYVDELVLPYRPRLVVLYAGDNDLAHGKNPEAVLNAYRAFVAEVHRALPEAPILYLAVKPSLARWPLIEAVREANRLVAADSAQDSSLAFIDIFTPMLDQDGRPLPELFASDGLHLSRAGYELWAEQLRPYLE